jgi:uncharacterized protein YciI
MGDESMKKLFAVTRTRGTNWKPGCPLEEQEEWASHAAFMDALQAQGFVVFGGPLEGTPDVLLIIRAEDAEEIHSRLAVDSWTRNGLLLTMRVAPWTIRLGKLNP